MLMDIGRNRAAERIKYIISGTECYFGFLTSGRGNSPRSETINFRKSLILKIISDNGVQAGGVKCLIR